MEETEVTADGVSEALGVQASETSSVGTVRSLTPLPFSGCLGFWEWIIVLTLIGSLARLIMGFVSEDSTAIGADILLVLLNVVLAYLFFTNSSFFPAALLIVLWLIAAVLLMIGLVDEAVLASLKAGAWTPYFLISERVKRTFHLEKYETELQVPLPPEVETARTDLLESLQADPGNVDPQEEEGAAEKSMRLFAESMKRFRVPYSRRVSELTNAGIEFAAARKLAKE